MRIEGAVALVTGGASGLGRATAEGLVAAGARVVLADLASSDGAAVAEGLGDAARFVPTDVTSEDDVARALDAADALGGARVVVSCAGIVLAQRVLGRSGVHALDAFRRVVDVNLVGTFNVVRLAAERMLALDPLGPDGPDPDGEERGVVVQTASVAAFDGQVGQAAYAPTQASVAGLTRPLARARSQLPSSVRTIPPGIIRTPMMASLPEAAQESLGAQVPHPSRLGRPEEYAHLVRAIVENPMLNGEVVRLDGAIRMAPR